MIRSSKMSILLLVLQKIIILNFTTTWHVDAARMTAMAKTQKRKAFFFEFKPAPPPTDPLPKKKKCKVSKGAVKTKSPKSKGIVADDECTEAPSLSPSISLAPSAKPSHSPTNTPSKAPSDRPSSSPTKAPTSTPSKLPSSVPSVQPTKSHAPSSSHQPSASLMPSSKPSFSFSPWCENGIQNGDTYVPLPDDIEWNTKYFYEMTYQSNANLTQVLEELDDSILKSLIEAHVWCGSNDSNRRSLSSGLALSHPGHVVGIKTHKLNHQRIGQKRSLLIDGISMKEIDTTQPELCSVLEAVSGETSCGNFRGAVTLYLRSDTTLNREEAKGMVLKTIKDGMDDESIANRVSQIDSLHYHGDSIPAAPKEPAGIVGLEQPYATASLSSMGVLVVAAGGIIALLIAFAATRRRDRYTYKRDVQFIEDDEFLFGKGIGLDGVDNETDTMSNGHVRILGDDDSDCSNLYGYGGGKRSNRLTEKNLCERADAMNVHHCRSATCQICSQNRLVDPVFVKAMFPDTAPSEMQPRRQRLERRDYDAPNTISL